MRYLAVALLLASPALADDPFLTGEPLAIAVKDCAHGCLVLTREQAGKWAQEMHDLLDKKEQAAHEAGRKKGSLSCRNAVKF